MSLRLWLPLNGNIKNKGAAKSTITAGGTVASTNPGGKCGLYTSFATNGYITATGAVPTLKFSISTWVYFTSISANSTICTCRTAVGGGIALFQLDSGHLRFDIGTTGTETSSVVISVNTWYHVCATYDGSTKKIYLNGSEIQSETRSLTSITSIGTKGWSLGGSQQGDILAPGGNYLSGYMNDFKIYDHCLTKKEILELRKCLICNLPLNRELVRPNLLPGIFDTTTSGWVQNGVSITKSNGVYTFTGAGTDSKRAYYNVSNFWVASTSYTISVDMKRTSSTSGTVTFSRSLVNNATAITPGTTWTRYTATISCTETASGGTISIVIPSGVVVQMRNFKIEKGTTATPYTQESTLPEIKDTSGFGNNGSYSESYAPTQETETSLQRYSGDLKSMVFNGSSSFINLGRTAMCRDEITVSVWAYMSDWSTFRGRLASCTEGGGWNFEYNNGYLNFAMGYGTTGNSYVAEPSSSTTGAENALVSNITSGWHLFTGTFNGITKILYIDGEQTYAIAGPSTKTPIYYNSTNSVFIGCEASSSATAAGGAFFNGKMLDFRIYGTALTASEVKKLYNSPIDIDPSGNIFATEYIEGTGSKIEKSGAITSPSFNTNGTLGSNAVRVYSTEFRSNDINEI